MGEVNLSRRKFVALGGAAAGMAAVAGLASCSSGSGSSSAAASSASASASASASTSASGAAGGKVDTAFASMEWSDILEEAKGQTVTFLAWGSGGADPFVQQWWDKLAEDVKSKYNVTIQYSEFDQAEYAKITTDLQNGADATYDMFWYTGAMIAPIRAAGKGVFGENWVKKLENYQYLDPNNSYVTFDGAAPTDGEESPFQGLNPSLVYSTDLWDHTIGWDQEANGKKGLPTNFTELAQWTAANPGRFTYMDLTGAGSFHGLFFLKAILAELTSDGNGGWKAVYDQGDSAEVRRKKIEENIEQWYSWSNSAEASEEAFYEKANYLWAFLNEIKPNLLQGDGGPAYMATAPDMMQRVIAGDLACTFTTCTSISERVAAAPDSYMPNPAIYMLQTSVGAWDYSVIMSNAKAKAAAMVVCNEMLDPSQQAIAFQTTGNGYNVDYGLLGSLPKKEFDDVFKAMGSLSPSTEEIARQSYTDKFGKVAAWIPTGWTKYVQS